MVRFNIILFLLVTFLSTESFSQRYPDPRVDSLLTAGIREIINQNYGQAESTFQNLDKKYSELPLGKIYLAAVQIAKAFDYSEPFNSDSIENELNSAKEKSEALVDKDKNNAWYQYFLALSEGYYAYYEAINKNWLSAFTNGLNSVSDFQKCLGLNENFYEAYTAIGTYKYWRSRKTEFLGWLPFVPKEEDLGIKYIKLSINHATYNRYLAVSSLIWIYIDQKKYKEADSLAKSALAEFPDNRQFKLEYARALEDINLKQAIKVYNEVLNSYQNIKGINRCRAITLKHIIAQQYKKLGDYNTALKLCDEILSINNLTPYEKEKLENRLERVKALKENLQKELAK